MTSEELEDKYPHWKDALFGNHNAVANLRCAAHYMFWHGAYALVAVVGVALIGALKITMTLASYLGPLAGPVQSIIGRLISAVTYVANHDYAKKTAEWGLIIFLVLAGLYIIGGAIYLLITQFWAFVGAIAFSLGFAVALVVVVLVADYLLPRIFGASTSVANYTASKARDAGKKAAKTPGVRRVYGECPVSMDMAPKWFDDIFPEEEY